MFAGSDVHGSTLGILGMGRIGQGIAKRGAHGFGMNVIYHNRSRLTPELEAACKARYVSKEELLKTADHLVLVLPYSAESHHSIAAKELALMKPTATLVNIARGGIVDDAALAQALREKRIAAAGLDVFEGEPKVHPDLLTVPNVVLTPHIASATVPTRKAMAKLAADNLIGFLVNGKPLTPLNPEVLNSVEIWIVMALALASVVLLVAVLLRKPPVMDTGRAELMAANERLERELRREISESSRGMRGELTQTLATFQEALVQQGAGGDPHPERADRRLRRASSR